VAAALGACLPAYRFVGEQRRAALDEMRDAARKHEWLFRGEQVKPCAGSPTSPQENPTTSDQS